MSYWFSFVPLGGSLIFTLIHTMSYERIWACTEPAEVLASIDAIRTYFAIVSKPVFIPTVTPAY